MSMCVLGMAEEFRADGIGVNALWPRTVIATAALAMIPGAREQLDQTRKPEIMADAAHAVLTRDARTTTGRFFLDEEVLREAGVDDFSVYAVKPGMPLLPTLPLTQRERTDFRGRAAPRLAVRRGRDGKAHESAARPTV
jgi:citronellol/citronellal dehydrogenase